MGQDTTSDSTIFKTLAILPVREVSTEKLRAGLISSSDEAVFTYSADMTEEAKSSIEAMIAQVPSVLQESLLKGGNAGPTDERAAFSSERVGDVIHVWIPSTGIATGNLVAFTILALCCKLPAVVLHRTTKGWAEPQLTSELEKKVNGIIVALQGAPTSFTSSSNPTDLMRLALWTSACSTAISKPGGQQNVVGGVIPEAISGADSAAKYLTKSFAALRAVTIDDEIASIKTLELLLQQWRREVEEDALNLITLQKIPWSAVLFKGAPTQKKKVKRVEVIQLVSPPKPSKSPWLSGKERQFVSSYYQKIWEYPDVLRTTWNGLSSDQQHSNYSNFVKELKTHYELMKQISSSVNAKLGHRKKFIETICREMQVVPKGKKDKANAFAWTVAFYKNNLTRWGNYQDLIKKFAPHHFMTGDEWSEDWRCIVSCELKRGITEKPDELRDIPRSRMVMWNIWRDIYAPTIDTKKLTKDYEDVDLEDENRFAVLSEYESTEEGEEEGDE